MPGRLSRRPMRERSKVLVVEDDERIRSLFEDTLVTLGYQVTTASTGIEAVELIQGQLFDTVLCDIRMPEMDGLEILRETLPGVEFDGAAALLILANGFVSAIVDVPGQKTLLGGSIYTSREARERLRAELKRFGRAAFRVTVWKTYQLLVVNGRLDPPCTVISASPSVRVTLTVRSAGG